MKNIFPVLLLILIAATPGLLHAQAGTGPGGVGNTAAPANLELWFKSDVGAFSDAACTVPAIANDPVACWADQSGNAQDATQSLEARQATFQTNVLNTTRIQSVLRFDGSSDFYTTTSLPAIGSNSRTLIAVITNGADNGEANQHIAHYGATGTRRAYGLAFRTNPNQTGDDTSNVGNHYWNLAFSSNQLQTADPLILAIQYNGSRDELFSNGFTQGTRTSLTLNTGTDFGLLIGSRISAIDGDEFFQGDIAELIAYGTEINSAERILIENYLSSKFDIALTANDQYSGDTLGNGDYDYEVAGIGQESDGSNFAAHSAGIIATDQSYLQDNSDYLIFGHASTTNSETNSDVPVGVATRWSRIWYVDISDAGGNGGTVDLDFDFLEGGFGGAPGGDTTFHLLARSGTSGDFTSIATTGTVVADRVTFGDLAVGDLSAQGPYFTVGFTASDADLSITKTDGQSSAIPGEMASYTITVTNNGPGSVVGATVSDIFPAAFVGVTWTCTPSAGASCTAAGANDIDDDLVDMPSGSTLTYVAMGTIDPAATGSLVNTATVTPPVDIEDPAAANNSATDTDTLLPTADLGITKTDGQRALFPGDLVTYTITVTNPGPSDATGVGVSDLFSDDLMGCSWTCAPSATGTCTAGPVNGDISDSADVPAGESVTYTAACTLDALAKGQLVNTASLTVPGGLTDPAAANNSDTDTDGIFEPLFDDAFESGDFSSWSSVIGDSSVVLGFSQMHEALKIGFRLDPEAAIGPALEHFEVVAGYAADETQIFAVDLRRQHGQVALRARLWDKSGQMHVGAWLEVPADKAGTGAAGTGAAGTGAAGTGAAGSGAAGSGAAGSGDLALEWRREGRLRLTLDGGQDREVTGMESGTDGLLYLVFPQLGQRPAIVDLATLDATR